MKRNLILGIMLIAVMSLYGQQKTEHIELLGKGITGMERASILVPDWQDVDYVIAEAVYACGKAPGDVKISSDTEDRIIEAREISCGGNSPEGMVTSVFWTEFKTPTKKVVLDIMENSPRFRSFALYIHRPDGSVNYLPAVGMQHFQGELVHVQRNDKVPELTAFILPVTSEARDVQLKFGLTEFKDDDIMGVFTFESEGETISTEVRTWFKNGQVDDYRVQEARFEHVSGKVDKILMTLFSAHDSKESFIAGRVFIDMQPNRIGLLTSSGN